MQVNGWKIPAPKVIVVIMIIAVLLSFMLMLNPEIHPSLPAAPAWVLFLCSTVGLIIVNKTIYVSSDSIQVHYHCLGIKRFIASDRISSIQCWMNSSVPKFYVAIDNCPPFNGCSDALRNQLSRLNDRFLYELKHPLRVIVIAVYDNNKENYIKQFQDTFPGKWLVFEPIELM